jgi:hypothetical protein
MPDGVVLRRCNYRHEAEMIRSVLEGDGIKALVFSDDCGSVDPALGLVRGVCVAVAAEDVERAEELLGQVAEPAGQPDDAGEPGQ